MASDADLTDTSQTIELADGRALGYLDIGDHDGFPVISCHGGLSSRLDVLPSAPSAAAHGLRVIAPDRPGIGLSDPKPGRTVLDWPDDVAELVAALGVDRYAVMGWSLGALYAQACGRSGADVSSVSLIASPIPVDWDGMRDEINTMDARFMKMSENKPGLERTIFHLMHGLAHRLPKVYARSTGVTGELAEQLPIAIAEGLTDPAGVVEDYRVMNTPWGFDPADITVPVHLWQGDADELVPPAWAQRLADVLPDATVTIVPGATHFLWYDHWDDIFAAVIR